MTRAKFVSCENLTIFRYEMTVFAHLWNKKALASRRRLIGASGWA